MDLFRRVYGQVRMNWNSYKQIKEAKPTLGGLTELTSQDETYNKLYIRILCLVVEAFHFQLEEMDDFASVVDERMELLAQDSLSAQALRQLRFIKMENERKRKMQKSNEQMEIESSTQSSTEVAEETLGEKVLDATPNSKGSSDSLHPTTDENIADTPLESAEQEVWREVKVARDQAEKAELKGTNSSLKEEDRHRILRLVLTVVIPDLRRLMVSTDSDKNQVVRSGVAVVLVQLLLHLPPKVMDMYIYLPSLIPSYLPGITQTVVLLLKQRLQSARDQARHTCNFLEGI